MNLISDGVQNRKEIYFSLKLLIALFRFSASVPPIPTVLLLLKLSVLKAPFNIYILQFFFPPAFCEYPTTICSLSRLGLTATEANAVAMALSHT